MKGTLNLALRPLRSPVSELRVVAAAVLLSAAAVSAVGLLADAVEAALQRQSASAIAADLAIETSLTPANKLLRPAEAAGLTATHFTEFASLIRKGENQTVVGIKAVTNGYPLRGNLLIADDLFQPALQTTHIPEPGTIWADDRLLSTLDIKTGEAIKIGNATFVLTQVLRLEPDRGDGFLALTPRVLMNKQDAEKTGLLVAGSRATHRLLVTGTPSALEVFRQDIAAQDNPDYKILTPTDARPEIQRALQRTERFLSLAVLSTLFLAGAAIALCSAGYAQRCRNEIALLKTLGCSQRRALSVVIWRLCIVAMLGALTGAVIGTALQEVATQAAAQMLKIEVESQWFIGTSAGFALGLISALGFALPALLPLAKVPPMQALQDHAASHRIQRWPVLLTLLILFLATWLLYTDLPLLIVGFAGTLLTFGILCSIGWLWIRLLALVQIKKPALRHGLAQLRRQSGFSLLQIGCLGVGLTALLMLAVVRNDIMQAWQHSLPPDAPNHFLVNVQAEEIPTIKAELTTAEIETPPFYGMVRGRLSHINDQPVAPESYNDIETERLLNRAWNLSWSEDLPPDNTLLEGEWWTAEELAQPLMSIEQYLVDKLDLKLGDKLSFDIAGEIVSVTVDNIREVEWDNMRANFFALTPPSVLADLPATYVAAIHVPTDKRSTLPNLARAFPTIVLLDVGAIIQQVRRLMDRASLAIQGVFIFTLIGGVLVLLACIQISSTRRRHEIGLLRSLGASRRWILSAQITEFAALGMVAGLTAATAAQLVAWTLAVWVFEYDYSPSISLWLWGIGGGVIGVVVAGLLGIRGSLSTSPMTVLR